MGYAIFWGNKCFCFQTPKLQLVKFFAYPYLAYPYFSKHSWRRRNTGHSSCLCGWRGGTCSMCSSPVELKNIACNKYYTIHWNLAVLIKFLNYPDSTPDSEVSPEMVMTTMTLRVLNRDPYPGIPFFWLPFFGTYRTGVNISYNF